VKRFVEGIKYQLLAKKRQGIHSPFVFYLANQVFPQRIPEEVAHILKAFDHRQSTSKEWIKFTELGAGSKRLNADRSVRKIHRHSSSGKHYGELLYKLSSSFKPTTILELGSSLGRGTLALHLGCPTANLYSIEGCPSTHQLAQKNIEVFSKHSENIHLINSSFDDFLMNLDSLIFDFVFIDGHHDGVALINYMERLRTNTHDETLFIIDDIRWSEGMWKAWSKIVRNEDFHVTIDLNRMGLFLGRRHQAKEHFMLRS
jgi:predicted O-methyltransferase YrrM